jgi:hypothetical protein
MKTGLVPFDDMPARTLRMGFEGYAEKIATALRQADPPCLTVGVFGDYGSGKTSLMLAIDRYVRQARPDHADVQNLGPILTVWFHPWRHDHERYLFLPFLATLLRDPDIAKEQFHKESLGTAFRAFLRGLSLKLPWGFELDVEKATRAERELAVAEQGQLARVTSGYTDITSVLRELTYAESAKKGTKRFNRRICVFVDDLDRCLPERAFGLLEAMKAFMDIEGFLFVFGLDPRVIKTYVDRKYGKEFGVGGEEYLEKLVQLPFQIPAITEVDLGEVLENLKATLPKKVAEGLVKAKKYLPPSIRRVKRLLNTHQVIFATSATPLDPELLLVLLVLQDKWPDVYDSLHRHRDALCQALTLCLGTGYQKTDFRDDPVASEARKTMEKMEFRAFFRDVVLPVLKCMPAGGSIVSYLLLMGKPRDKLAGARGRERSEGG